MSGNEGKNISILFWNIDKSTGNIDLLLNDINIDSIKRPTILALAEAGKLVNVPLGYREITTPREKVRVYIQQDLIEPVVKFHSYSDLEKRIGKKVFTSFFAEKDTFTNRFSMCELNFVHGNQEESVLMFFVHLFDKQSYTELRQYICASHFAELFYQIEKSFKFGTSIIMGDFNMHPFEQGMILKECFNSSASVMELYKYPHGRPPIDLDRRFYNPMSLMNGNELEYGFVDKEDDSNKTIPSIKFLKKKSLDKIFEKWILNVKVTKTRYGTIKYDGKEFIFDMVLMKERFYERYFESVGIIFTEQSDHLPILLTLAGNFSQ